MRINSGSGSYSTAQEKKSLQYLGEKIVTTTTPPFVTTTTTLWRLVHVPILIASHVQLGVTFVWIFSLILRNTVIGHAIY
jgi:hypothetical protein